MTGRSSNREEGFILAHGFRRCNKCLLGSVHLGRKSQQKCVAKEVFTPWKTVISEKGPRNLEIPTLGRPLTLVMLTFLSFHGISSQHYQWGTQPSKPLKNISCSNLTKPQICDHFSEINVLRLWLAEEMMGSRSVGEGYLFKGVWLNLTKYSSDEVSSLGADHWVPWLPLHSVDKTQRMHSYGPCILATPCSGRTEV